MKIFGSTIIFFLLPFLLSGQIRFSVEAKGLDKDYILVEKPFDGKYIPSAPEKILRGKKGRFLIETNDTVPRVYADTFWKQPKVLKYFWKQT